MKIIGALRKYKDLGPNFSNPEYVAKPSRVELLGEQRAFEG